MRVTHSLVVAIVILATAAAVSGMTIDDKLTLNFSERFRFVSWDNAINLDKYSNSATTFTRHRTTVEGIWTPATRFGLHIQMTNEFRYYFSPSYVAQTLQEVFFDNLFITGKPFAHLPLTITIGRQNIILDEGFIVMDGTPLDGSRGIYFNATRADWRFGERHTLTGFACRQDPTDKWLPVIHDQDQALIEQPETGVGLYYKRPVREADLSLYVVHKDNKSALSVPVDAYVTTVGTRLVFPFGKGHRFVVEGALQDGRQDGRDMSAFGGYTYIELATAAKEAPWFMPRMLSGGAIALSGDDPATGEFEGWNPMFARWPKWSEAYIYTQILENGVAYWTNLFSVYGIVGLDISPRMAFKATYHHMMAFERASGNSGFPGGTGTTRGELLIGHLGYSFDSHWSGHIHWESFFPGDFYFDSADTFSWLRMELMFRY